MSNSRPREEARRENQRPHVLIVTDDPSLATFLSEGLLMGGFWASVISHGLQVLEVFRLRRFDLIVIDHDLDTFSAMELVRRLRGCSSRSESDPTRSNAPIILVAGDEPEIEQASRTVFGIVDVLVAPLELENVVQTLHHQFGIWRRDNPDHPLADEV